jgi:hypothetical protein
MLRVRFAPQRSKIESDSESDAERCRYKRQMNKSGNEQQQQQSLKSQVYTVLFLNYKKILTYLKKLIL